MKIAQSLENKNAISGVEIDTNQARIILKSVPDKPGIASKLFSEISSYGYSVDMIIQSNQQTHKNSISFTIKKDDISDIKNIVGRISEEIECKTIEVDTSLAKVSIVGIGMLGKAGIAAKMFKTLGEEGINIQMINTSETKISCIVNLNDADKAAKAIYKNLIFKE